MLNGGARNFCSLAIDTLQKLGFSQPMYKFMNMRFLRLGVVSAAFLLSSAAFACCTEVDAQAAFASGDFALAYERAAPLPSKQGQFIALEALSAKLLLGTADSPKRMAKTARALAASALETDPANPEVQMQYALVDGFVTRTAAPFKAYRKKLPQKTKAVVDDFIAASPHDGRAHALLGAWHVGVVRKAGEKNAENWFDADFASGQRAYEHALTLRPGDIIISSNYALSLLEHDPLLHSQRAKLMLSTAAAAQTTDPVEKAVQQRMDVILNLWDDHKARDKSAKSFLDGKG